MHGSMRDGTARPSHLDQHFHLEFVAPAAEFSLVQLVQSEQPESTLAVADLAADERGSQPAADDVREISGAGHQGAIETAGADDQVGSSFFGDAKHSRDILGQVLAVAIQGDYISKITVARVRNPSAYGRGLAAVSWQLQAGSSRGPGGLRGSVVGSIVDHHHLCHMPAGPLHNACDVGGLVEGGNQGTGSHMGKSTVPAASSRGPARTNSKPLALSSSITPGKACSMTSVPPGK